MARTSKAAQKLANRNSLYEPSGLDPFSEDAEAFPTARSPEPEARTSRTWGEAASDTAVGAVKGVVGGVQNIADFASAITPGFEDDLTSGPIDTPLNWAQDKLQTAKSEVIKIKEQRLSSMISDPNVPVSEVLGYFTSNISDLGSQVAVESLGAMAVGAGVTGVAAKFAAIRSVMMQGGMRAAAVGGIGESAQIAGDVYRNTGGDTTAMWEGLGMGLVTSAVTPGNVGSAIGKRLATREAVKEGENIVEQGIGDVAQRGLIGRRMSENSLTGGALRTGEAVLAEGAQEYGQEGLQSVIEQASAGDVDWSQVGKKAGIGAIVGGAMGGGIHLTPMGEGGVGTRDQINAVRSAQEQLASAQQVLATNPTDPAAQSAVDSARANLASLSLSPAEQQTAADAAVQAQTAQIVSPQTETVDQAIGGFNVQQQTSSDLRTGAQVANEAHTAIASLTAPVLTPGATVESGTTDQGGTYDAATAEEAPLVAAINLPHAAEIAAATNDPALRQLAAHAIDQDSTLNIASIVGRMTGDRSAGTPITRPESVPQATWDNFVRAAQDQTGVMVPLTNSHGRTIHDNLLDIANNGARPHRLLAQRLLDTNNPNLDMMVEPMNAADHIASPNARGRILVAPGGEVTRFQMSPVRGTESTFLHETLHAVTMRWLSTAETTDPLYQELLDLTNKVKAEADRRGIHPYGTHPTGVTQDRIRMSEFLAEAFTRASFQQFLDTIPVSTNRTAWAAFRDWVAKITGSTGTRGEITALDLALRLNEDVMTRSTEAEVALRPAPAAAPEPAATPEPTPAAATPEAIYREAMRARGDSDATIDRDISTMRGYDDEMLRSFADERNLSPVGMNMRDLAQAILDERAAVAASVATPEPSEPTVSPDALASARETWIDQTGNDPARADFIESMDRAALEGIVADTRRPRLAAYVQAVLDHAAAGHPTRMTEQPTGSPEVVAAITHMREVARQNGETAMRTEDNISDARDAVRDQTIGQLDREVAALENANQNSLASLYRALMAERTAASAATQDQTAALRQAALDAYVAEGISGEQAEQLAIELENFSDADLRNNAFSSPPGEDPVADYAMHLLDQRTMLVSNASFTAVRTAPSALDTARDAARASGLLPASITAIEGQTFGQHVAAYNNINSDRVMREYRFALAEAEAARTGTRMLMTQGEFNAREDAFADAVRGIDTISSRVADLLAETLSNYNPVQLNNLANGLNPSGAGPVMSHAAEQIAAARVGIAFQNALPMDLVSTIVTPVSPTPAPAATLTSAQRGARTRARNALLTAISDRVRAAGSDIPQQGALFNTLNRGRPSGSRQRMTPTQRAYLSLINQVGVDEAREWAINRFNRTLTAQGHPMPQNLRDWLAVRNGTSSIAPTPPPATNALAGDVASAAAELDSIAPADHNGVRMTSAHIATLGELELENALREASANFQNRTAALIRAHLNVAAEAAGRPRPYPRWNPISSLSQPATVGARQTPVREGEAQESLPSTAVDAPALPPPSFNAEQDFTSRLNAAQQSGALTALAEFWNRITGQPGQRMFGQDEIPLDDLRALTRANNNKLTQAILTTLKERYNDAFHNHAVQWALEHGQPAPANEPIITSLSLSGLAGDRANIELFGVGRNGANPFTRAGLEGNSSIGVSSTTTGISRSPGASDICYRIVADMMYMTGKTSHNTNGLCTNNNVRRQWQSFAQGMRLGNADLIHPIGSNGFERGQGMPPEYTRLSATERLGANALRVAHNAWYRRVGTGTAIPKARVLSNLVLNPDALTYTALYDPVDTRGFARGSVVTKQDVKDKISEIHSYDTSRSGGYGIDTVTFAMLTDQFLEAFENNVSPIALETMAVNYGADSGGWLMSQDGGAIDPISQSLADLMAESGRPGTTNARRAEINAEIRSLQQQRSQNAQEANSFEALDMNNVNRMVGELRTMGDIGERFEAAGSGRALNSQDAGTVPSDPEVAATPAAQIAVTTPLVQPASQNEVRIVGHSGQTAFNRYTESIIKALQNKNAALGRVLRIIGDQTVLGGIDRFDGLVQASIKRLVGIPIAKLEGILNKANISRAAFETYLKMRHAQEYNEHIARIDPLQVDANGARIRGFDLEQFPGSSISNSEAQTYMAQAPSAEMLDAAEVYDAMNKAAREFAIETGITDRATVNGWETTFKKYTPFRRSLDTESLALGTASGFSVREGFTRHALGSSAEILDPLAATVSQIASLAERGEKARVSQMMLNTARHRSIPMFQTPGGAWKPMWVLHTIPNIRTLKRLRVYNVIGSDGNAMLNSAGMPIEFYNGSEARAYAATQNTPGGNPVTVRDTGFQNRVVSAHNPAYINKPNVLIVPENGKNTMLVFNENSEDAMSIVTNMKNLNVAQVDGFLGAANVFSRWVVGTSTGYNPMFAPINFIRDIFSSAINITSDKIPGWSAADSVKLMGNATKNINPLRTYLNEQHKARHSNGVAMAVPAPGSAAEMMERAAKAGGLTGIRESISTYEDALRQMQHLFGEDLTSETDPRRRNDLANKLTDKMNAAGDNFGRFLEGNVRNKTLKTLSNVPVMISNMNNAFELATRVAAFEGALRKFEAAGMTTKEAELKAALVSKNVSVNFNRRGNWTGRLNALYPFFNASVQGSARLSELLFEKRQVKNADGSVEERTRLSSTGKKVLAALPALGVFQALLLAAGGFDDKQPPEWVRSRNFIIPTGGKDYAMIPMPLGLNALFNMGREAADAAMHPENAMKHLGSVLSEPLSAFNPMGSTPNGLLQIMPSILDIPVALLENKDAFDRPIAKLDRDLRRPTPGFTRQKESTSTTAVGIAHALNTMTGGNDYRPGAINITGDQVEYVGGQIGGGIFREASRAVQFASGDVESADRPWHKVPLVGKFYGSAGDSSAVRDRLYNTSADLNVLNAEYNGLKDDKKFAEAQAFRKANPELDLHDDMDRYFKEESKLRKQRMAAKEEGTKEEAAKLNATMRTKGERLLAEVEKAKSRATLH